MLALPSILAYLPSMLGTLPASALAGGISVARWYRIVRTLPMTIYGQGKSGVALLTSALLHVVASRAPTECYTYCAQQFPHLESKCKDFSELKQSPHLDPFPMDLRKEHCLTSYSIKSCQRTCCDAYCADAVVEEKTCDRTVAYAFMVRSTLPYWDLWTRYFVSAC